MTEEKGTDQRPIASGPEQLRDNLDRVDAKLRLLRAQLDRGGPFDVHDVGRLNRAIEQLLAAPNGF